MERALDPELLELALGDHRRLPSVEEFSGALEEAELNILRGRQEVEETVLPTAWLLHAIASSRHAAELYGPNRQRAAFRVAGHAFDLVLQNEEHDWLDRAQLTFAAQVAFVRSEQDPNSLAVYRRELRGSRPSVSLLSGPSQFGIASAAAVMGFDANFIFENTDGLASELEELAAELGVDRIDDTVFGAAGNVAAGCRDLIVFFIYGRLGRLGAAEERFTRAVGNADSSSDLISRWAAAHLLNLLPHIRASSIWTALPPEVPPDVRRAFSIASPRVFTLWPSQLQFVTGLGEGELSPFDAGSRRQLVSTPTSGGKTLLAQLVIASHIHEANTGVCYVAPTRSLCREVRNTLTGRLRCVTPSRIEQRATWDDPSRVDEGPPEVEVMTPERLSFLLRQDAQAVMGRFGLFVFDEVHTVGDAARGWTLEQDLALLHHATRDTDHRLLLMSAAIGNQAHFATWMGGEEEIQIHHSEWQGPRRMHAIFGTAADWESAETEPRDSEEFPIRQRAPLHGVLHVRSGGDRYLDLRTTEPVGELVLKKRTLADPGTKDTGSTPNYKLLIVLLQHLRSLGPVLIIEGSKVQTRRMAEALAASQPADPEIRPELAPLLDLVRDRLGQDHPLHTVLQRGVAYHHGSLPIEVRQGIEDAVSAGLMKLVVATTTMTAGVNLPVRSVVIASQGFFSGTGFVQHITGARLLNAIGRAGRAAKETEGLVVLALFNEFTADAFDRLDPDPEELRVSSWLASEEALESLAGFEDLVRRAEDAVLESTEGPVSAFLSYVWFIASELERLTLPRTAEQFLPWLQATLAWVQLGAEQRQRWLSVAEEALHRYDETDPVRRNRWARAGTSIGNAAQIDDLAQQVALALLVREQAPSGPGAIALVFEGERLQRLLTIPGAPSIEVRTRRRSGNPVDLDLRRLIQAWLEGVPLVDLANDFLGDVEDVEFRAEQLGRLINDLFELHLSWVLRLVVDAANERLAEWGVDHRYPEHLPALMRWGVSHSSAARLMSRGLASRSLATRIVAEWIADPTDDDVLSWIQSLPRSEWRTRFGASVAELRNLVTIIYPRSADVLNPFLLGEAIEVPIRSDENVDIELGAVSISLPPESYAPIRIVAHGQVVATVRPDYHADVLAILDLGVRLEANVIESTGLPVLELLLVEPQ